MPTLMCTASFRLQESIQEPSNPVPSHPDPNYPVPSHPDPNYPDPNYPDPINPDPNYPDPSNLDPNKERDETEKLLKKNKKGIKKYWQKRKMRLLFLLKVLL